MPAITIAPADARRAERGAAFFDEVKPGWAHLTNKEALNIADPFECIAGQIFRADTTGMQSGYNYAVSVYPNLAATPCEFGLCCSSGTLHAAWFTEIDKRLIADAYGGPDDPREGK